MNYLKDNFWNTETNRIDGLKLWNALQLHIEKGELVVNEGKDDREGLMLVTYSKTYQYEHNSVAWDPLVQHCRGIIFDAADNYKIVALPFSKFFNYGEGGIHYPSVGSEISSVYEKKDGSLGIAFWWKNKWQLTTRGSLNSDIGAVGQKILDDILQVKDFGLDPNNTYLFEIIDPICRIVVVYKSSTLVLLGCRNCKTGITRFDRDTIPEWHPYAGRYEFTNKEEMVTWLNQTKGTEFEGFVVHFSDDSIFKFKSEDYMRLHRIVAQFSFKRVLESIQDGSSEEVRKALPEELIPQFDNYSQLINEHVKKLEDRVKHVYNNAPKNTRKELALYLKEFYKDSEIIKFIFKLDDHKDPAKLHAHILQSLKVADFKVDETTESICNT